MWQSVAVVHSPMTVAVSGIERLNSLLLRLTKFKAPLIMKALVLELCAGCRHFMVQKPLRALRQERRLPNLVRQVPRRSTVAHREQAQLRIPVCSLQSAHHRHVPALVQRRGCQTGCRRAVIAQSHAEAPRVHPVQGEDSVPPHRTILGLLPGIFTTL